MTAKRQQRDISIWAISAVALGFGMLTIKEGGMVLFGDDAARAAAGNYVPFVVWFNFVAGFAYVVAGAGLWLQQRWALYLAIGIAMATALAFAVLGMHINSGELYELRTVIAMTLRTLVWITISSLAWQSLRRG